MQTRRHFLAAVFECIDITRRRSDYEEPWKNPLRKMTSEVLANAEDEKKLKSNNTWRFLIESFSTP